MENWLEKWIDAKLSDIYSVLKDTNVDSVDFLILEQKVELLNELRQQLKK